MEEKIRAVLYARVSTDNGRQETENQLVQLRELAAKENWSVVQEYVDHESGGRADRRQFQRLFHDAEQRTFDVVLFWALDRFSREGSLETLQHLDRLSKFGVGFRSLNESYLDSCGIFKDAIIALLGAIAEQERLRIGERVHAGLSRAREHGTRSGRPIGRPKAVFHRETAIELRRSGLSWGQISRKLGVGSTTVRTACKGAVEPCRNPGEGNGHG